MSLEMRLLTYKDAAGQIRSLRLTDDALLFASKREDYLEVVRKGLEALK